MKRPVTDTERSRLGLDAPISRRDFLNGSLAAGGALAVPAGSADADTFTGYGGVGDYARANGNTWPVVQAAHRLRDGGYNQAVMDAARDAGQFDLVVVGGGIAGLSAAHRFRQLRGATARILILENHAMPGGEAKQNEFDVEGIRLLGPQGSNDFGLPGQRSDSLTDSFFEEFALPREYQWQRWDSALKPLRFARDNYSNMDGFQETQVDVGYFFDRGQGADTPCWRRNIWSSALDDTPYSDVARRDLLRWRANHGGRGERGGESLPRYGSPHHREGIWRTCEATMPPSRAWSSPSSACGRASAPMRPARGWVGSWWKIPPGPWRCRSQAVIRHFRARCCEHCCRRRCRVEISTVCYTGTSTSEPSTAQPRACACGSMPPPCACGTRAVMPTRWRWSTSGVEGYSMCVPARWSWQAAAGSTNACSWTCPRICAPPTDSSATHRRSSSTWRCASGASCTIWMLRPVAGSMTPTDWATAATYARTW